MAVITFVGRGTWVTQSPSSTSYSVNVPMPSGVQAGDLLLLTYSVNRPASGTGSAFVPADQAWVSQASNYSTFGAMQVWSKLATAADIANGFVTASIASSGGQPTFGYFLSAWRGPAIRVDAGAGQAASTSTAAVPGVKADAQGIVFSSLAYTYGGGSSSPTGPAGWAQTMVSTGFPSMAYFVAPTRTAAAGTQPAMPTGGTFDYLTVYLNGNVAPLTPAWLDAGGTVDGAVVDRSQPTPLAWAPNDPDGDPQAGYTLRARPFGSLGAWHVIDRPTAGATAAGTIPANTLAGRCEVQVATYDGVIGRGPFSASRVITFTDVGLTPSTVPAKVDPGMILSLTQAQRAIFPAVAP